MELKGGARVCPVCGRVERSTADYGCNGVSSWRAGINEVAAARRDRTLRAARRGRK